MRVFRKVCAVVYLLAAVVALGGFAAYLFSPVGEAFAQELARSFPLRVFMAVCLSIAGVGALGLTIALFAQKVEPECLHTADNQNIEVSLAALKSCARAALANERDVLIERVGAHVAGSDHASVAFKIEAIALTEENLPALGERIQQTVVNACASLVGADAVSCHVRFLPAKTTTRTQEVSGE